MVERGERVESPLASPSWPRLAGFAALLLPFDDHVILDGFHALDLARNFDGLVDIGARSDEAVQLNNAFVSCDVDFGQLQRRFFKNC